MSRTKLLVILIAVATFGVGAIAVRVNFSEHSRIAGGREDAVMAPNNDRLTQQERAEKKSVQQTIDSDCAALRKMGATNKNCPPN